MTNDPREPGTEKALEQDMERIRNVWAKQEKVDPPELVNMAVLKQAERELEKRKRSDWRWFSSRGLGAFATAAVVVIAFSLVVQQQDDAPIPVSSEMDGMKLDSDDAPTVQARRSLNAKSESAEREAPSPSAFQDRATVSEQAMPEKRLAPRAEESSTASLPEPEVWIQNLLTLKASGNESLSAELAAFRAAYPDYPLPPELDD